MNRLFSAQERCPSELEPVDWPLLTPFQRALMITDGMVTQLIEAYVLERIEIVTLAQEERTLEVENAWLESSLGAPIVARDVLLRGRESAATYVYGDSILATERLPAAMRRDLLESEEGIGRLVQRYQLETRRQLLWCGIERQSQMPDGVRGDFLYRSYRILSGTLPLMIIDERFPL